MVHILLVGIHMLLLCVCVCGGGDDMVEEVVVVLLLCVGEGMDTCTDGGQEVCMHA